MRHDFTRSEDIATSEGPQPAPTSSSSTAEDVVINSIDNKKKNARFDDGVKAMDSVLSEGRPAADMRVLRKVLKCRNDISEVYSPPRVVTVAEAAGLRGGFSLDLTIPSAETER